MKPVDLKEILTRSRRAQSEDVASSPLPQGTNLVEELVQAYSACMPDEERRSKGFALLSRVSSRDNVTGTAFLELVLVFLRTRRLEQPHLLWRLVADSFPRSVLHYRILHALLTTHFASLGPLLRRDAFRYVTLDNNCTDDFGEKLRVLAALTANGRDLSPIETDLGDVATEWLTNQFDKLAPAHVRELLGLLSRAVASSPAFLSAENKTLLLQRACVVASSLRVASQVPVVESCLSFLEAVVQHDVVLPAHCLAPMVASLCCTVNIDKLCEQSWRVGRCLLGSRAYGGETMDALCAILQARRNLSSSASSASVTQNAGSIIRGAVFFVGMSCWGKDKVDSLHVAPATVLAAMVQAVRCGYSVAAYEVLLSVRRLIRKQGPELAVEWDSIFIILYEMTAYTSSNPSFVRVLVDTLGSLRVLSDSNRFLADPQRQLWLLEAHSTLLPPRDSLRLLRTRLAQVPPLVTDAQLDQCLRKHLIEDTRTEARMAALSEVMDWLTHGSASGAIVDEDRAKLVLPVWRSLIESLLSTPQGQERGSLLSLMQAVVRRVAEAAIGVRRHLFLDCIGALLSVAVPSGNGESKRNNTVLSQVFDDAAAEGLALVMAAELAASRGRRARIAFEALVDLIPHPSVSVRQRVLHYISAVRAEPSHMVSLFGKQSCVKIAATTDTSKTELSMARAVEMLARQARVETSKTVLSAIYLTFQEWLWNRFILRGVVLDFFAAELCSTLRDGKLPEPFRGQSHEGLEHVKVMVNVASLLVAYTDQFRQGVAIVGEVSRTFLQLLKFPFAGGVFDAPGRAAIQRICLNGLCVAAAHHAEVLPPLAPAIIDALCPLMQIKFLEPHVPQALNFLSRFPAFVSALSLSHIVAIVETLAIGSSGAKSAAAASTPPPVPNLWLYSYRLKTTALWLLCAPPVDRPYCYNRILPSLLNHVGGPTSLLVEACLDWMANIVFLQFSPGRGAVGAASERFGFAGRPSVVVVQGNSVMEIVAGAQDWCLVSIRRPSGRVAWVTRMLHDVYPLAAAALNGSYTHSPIHQPHLSLFRAPEQQQLRPAIEHRASPDVAASVLESPIPQSALALSQQLIVDASPISSSVLEWSAGMTSLADTSAPSAPAAASLVIDPPPLNPKGVLEKKMPKPNVTDYFILESPRANSATPVAVVHAPEDSASADEDSDLRMAPLFSYNEGDELEEERGAFFGAHSLNGSRAQSMGSSSSVSPQGATVPMKRDSRADPAPQSTVTAAMLLKRSSEPLVGGVSGVVVLPSSRRMSEAHERPSSGALSSPGTPTSPVVTAQERLRIDAAAVAAPPHASLLFVQLRYVPFSDETPILVTPTPTMQRAISVLDYMPPFTTHKCGVLFVAKGQRTEAEIFANQRGTVAYSRFLKSVGDMVRLKGYQGYAGGLDTSADTDGQFSVRFRDEALEVMLHCATLMPPGNLLAKKRHLGNDNVMLVWDESHEFDPKVLQSAFNHVSIVITPVGALARVSVFRKREMGHFLPISLNQLARLEVLPALVLHTAILADREVQAILSSEEPLAGISLRLKQIRKIKTLAKQQHAEQ